MIRAALYLTSFAVAALLFAVQPMVSKLVLPTFGGTAAVWTTVMFTFQLLLLLGYLYAHSLTRLPSARQQVIAHAALVVSCALFLPLHIAIADSPALIEAPIRTLVMALLTQIGLPFFCVSATAPLLQSWVSRSTHALAKRPYVLYSASNLGSFAGLLGYVALIEPLLDLTHQRTAWSGGFAGAMLLLLLLGWKLTATASPIPRISAAARLSLRECALWVWLAFLVSSASLGVTTYITTDIASMPLLWVIPLALYLLSFVDAFRDHPLLVPFAQRLAPTLALFALMIYVAAGYGVLSSYALHLMTFAVLALALHGWLAARKPEPAQLTFFYVLISVGGLLGGVMNGLLAPLLLPDAYEYPVVTLLAGATAFLLLRRSEAAAPPLAALLKTSITTVLGTLALTALIYAIQLALGMEQAQTGLNSSMLVHSAALACVIVALIGRRFVVLYFAAAGMCAVGILAVANGAVGHRTLFKDRNFFGVSRVYEHPAMHARYYMHGTTLHGVQSLDPAQATTPQAYYALVRQVVAALPIAAQQPIAIVGLGVGTLKCLAHEGQEIDLYEIDPMVHRIAENTDYFTYMRDCKGTAHVWMGDGRIEIAKQSPGRYGLIVLDAFSSDAIPSHLLTREAMARYFEVLSAHGVLLINTSNRHIDLAPLLALQAEQAGAVAYGKYFVAPSDQPLLRNATWVMIARQPSDVETVLRRNEGWNRLVAGKGRAWTDEYTNLLPYLKALHYTAPQ